MFATIGGALYPSTAGGSVQTHEIAGTGHTVKINGDMTVGEVYDSEGSPTGISVIASGTDSNGSLVGFTPLTEQDAQRLGSLLGSDIGTENVLDTTMNSESTQGGSEGTEGSEATSSLEEPIPSTGDSDLDELMGGTVRNPNTDEAVPNQNLQTPVSK